MKEILYYDPQLYINIFFQLRGIGDIEIDLNTVFMFLLFSVVNNFNSQITKNILIY